MEEKKLTDTYIDVGMNDEEIIKALKFAIAQGEPDGIGFWSGNMRWREFSMQDVLYLINRLQDEIKEYETLFDIFNERKYRKMFIEEWKKEYQKELDKQGEGVIAGFPDGDYVYKRYFEQKAEIERLTEVWADFRQEVITLNIEKLELQKKVEELKKVNNDLLHERQMAFMDGHQQAVKDTANKVYKGLCERKNWNDMKEAIRWGNESEELKALISKIVGVEVK